MAFDHAHQNIRVNCVCPGDTDTPMLRDEARQMSLSVEGFLVGTADRPMGRLGTPEPGRCFSSPVRLLPNITGTILVIDGGGLAGAG